MIQPSLPSRALVNAAILCVASDPRRPTQAPRVGVLEAAEMAARAPLHRSYRPIRQLPRRMTVSGAFETLSQRRVWGRALAFGLGRNVVTGISSIEDRVVVLAPNSFGHRTPWNSQIRLANVAASNIRQAFRIDTNQAPLLCLFAVRDFENIRVGSPLPLILQELAEVI